MAVYVDQLRARGWILNGKEVDSCHLFSDQGREELVSFAAKTGIPARWVCLSKARKRGQVMHFDLTEGMRRRAIAYGAVELEDREAAKIWRGPQENSQHNKKIKAGGNL